MQVMSSMVLSGSKHGSGSGGLLISWWREVAAGAEVGRVGQRWSIPASWDGLKKGLGTSVGRVPGFPPLPPTQCWDSETVGQSICLEEEEQRLNTGLGCKFL